jgi:F420-non-reducing hydrogenase iron-sulfur subunit
MGVHGLVAKVLTEVGIRPERFNLQWASAAEAPRFVKLITTFTQQIKELGPLGQAEGLTPEEAKARVQKALDLVSDRKLRMGFGNVTKTLRQEGGKVTDELIAKTIDEKLSKTISSALGG